MEASTVQVCGVSVGSAHLCLGDDTADPYDDGIIESGCGYGNVGCNVQEIYQQMRISLEQVITPTAGPPSTAREVASFGRVLEGASSSLGSPAAYGECTPDLLEGEFSVLKAAASVGSSASKGVGGYHDRRAFAILQKGQSSALMGIAMLSDPSAEPPVVATQRRASRGTQPSIDSVGIVS
jgi:hypothetical protein